MELKLNQDLNELSNQELLTNMQTVCDKHEQQKSNILEIIEKYDKELVKLKSFEEKYLEIVNILVNRNILNKEDLKKYEN